MVDEFNRTAYLCSVDLVLLQVGKSEIYANPVIDEPYIVRYPREEATVSGGVLEVSGVAQVLNDQPLIFDLVAENGEVVGSVLQEVFTPVRGSFSYPVRRLHPYAVRESTGVRLTIRQESATRIPGTVWLESWLLTLEP